ncbi:MAG TPA: sulfotransferase [Xanthomonadaceae bacterium]|jgi:tetratricopeptide (TPR) repeat protein
MNESVDGLIQSARGFLASEQPAAARAVLDRLLAIEPDHVDAHLLLGGIAWRENRRRDTVRHALDAARIASREGRSLLAVASALVHVGETMAAKQSLDHPFFAETGDHAVLVQAAALRQMLDQHPAALALLERAHALGLDGFEYRFDHAIQLAFNGRLREAEDEFEQCIGLGVPSGRAYVNLARMRRQTPERNHLRSIEGMLRLAAPGSEDEAGLEFARYKELEDLGRFDEAWRALSRGNAIMARDSVYVPERRERLLEGLRELCTPEFLRPVESAQAGPMPIFVIGMTRSGTTVLERILDNHSQIRSAGEIKDFGAQLAYGANEATQRVLDGRMLARLPGVDYAEVGARYLAQTQWRAEGRSYFVDKFPPNWQVAGLIRRALPGARILHLVREPMDVCFSNYRAVFGRSYMWSYDLDHLAHYHRQYRRTMAHWHAVMPGQILDVHYADLAREPEVVARKVFEFCGLDHEQGCADLSRNTTAVASWSMAQVRGGIHARAFEEWRPYEAQLAGLRAALEAG